MLFAETDQVFFAYKRFAACIDIHIYTKFFSLGDDIVNFIVGQVQFMAIFCSPAAGTVQIAGRSRIKKDCPWNITVIFCTKLFFLWPADQCCIDKKINSQCFCNIRIYFLKYFSNIGVIWMFRVFNCFTDCFSLGRESAL